jgi:hypothetical protein
MTTRRWFPGISFEIDPDAKAKTYTIDWSDWVPTGATIASHEIVPATGLTVVDSVAEGTQVTVAVDGVAEGEKVGLTCRVTLDTIPPMTDDRTILLCGVHQ